MKIVETSVARQASKRDNCRKMQEINKLNEEAKKAGMSYGNYVAMQYSKLVTVGSHSF